MAKPPVEYRPKKVLPKRASEKAEVVGASPTVHAPKATESLVHSSASRVPPPSEESAEAVLARIREKTKLRVRKHRKALIDQPNTRE